MAYFQKLGVAEAELERDVHTTMHKFFYCTFGNAPQLQDGPQQPVVPEGKGILDIMVEPQTLLGWLTDADIDFYATEFKRTGFSGGLNWYRTIDKSWELMAAWNGAPLQPPTLYVAADRDLTVQFPGSSELIANQQVFVPNLKRTIILPGCGHWTQQECPDEVNAAILEFLRDL